MLLKELITQLDAIDKVHPNLIVESRTTIGKLSHVIAVRVKGVHVIIQGDSV